MKCPHCDSQKIIKNGKHHHQDGKAIQNYLCKECGKRFSERTGTPMSRLRTPADLFKQATSTAWSWAKTSQYIRWFTDGERHYAQQLWKMASVYLKLSEVTPEYGYRKVWRYGLEVAMKIKGSQGNRRVEWVKPEHPYTAISGKSDVHANHNEANNSALRRRCSAFRCRQNLYAKNTEGLQRTVTVQRLIHNWVRPHVILGKNKTPAMAIGLFHRPISMLELLSSRGFHCLTN